MSTVTEIGKIPLAGTKKGIISVSNVSEPYGAGTDDIVSVGIALNGVDIEWKAHIPYGNIDAVVELLKKAQENKA